MSRARCEEISCSAARILFEGERVRFKEPAEAVRRGICYITEDRKLNGFFETMSISDNIYVGWLAAHANEFIVGRGMRNRVAEEWLKRLAIRAITPAARVSELSGGNQQKVVIAKTLAQRPKLIIFDEPTSGRRCWSNRGDSRLHTQSSRRGRRGRGYLLLLAGSH